MVQATRPGIPSPAQSRVLQWEQLQHRIVQAATDTVAEHGWQGAQMALIAAKAGVATGSMYRHFTSKADLFAQVLAVVSQREVDVVDEIGRGTGTAAVRLRQAVTAFMKRALKRRRLAYALIAEPCEPEIDRARLVYRAALVQSFERLIADGVRRGEFHTTQASTAASCVGGAMMEALVGPLAPDVPADSRAAGALVRCTADLCVTMLGGMSAGAR